MSRVVPMPRRSVSASSQFPNKQTNKQTKQLIGLLLNGSKLFRFSNGPKGPIATPRRLPSRQVDTMQGVSQREQSVGE